MSEDENFYKGLLFSELTARFDTLDSRLSSQDKKLEEIQGQLRWVYGWATGVGFAATFLWSYVKGKIWD